jgi:hypothetical protein
VARWASGRLYGLRPGIRQSVKLVHTGAFSVLVAQFAHPDVCGSAVMARVGSQPQQMLG